MKNVWDQLDPPLAKRAKELLWSLQLIAAASGRGIILRQSRSAEKDPNGIGGPKGERFTLYETWVEKFAPAVIEGDEEKVLGLCVQLETFIERLRGQHKAEIELPTDDKAAAAKVIQDFEDVDSVEVARRLLVPPEWVRGVRMRAPTENHELPRLDPKSGKRYEGWRGWSDVQRIQEVRRCRRRGWLQATVAAEFGVCPRTIHSVWQEAA